MISGHGIDLKHLLHIFSMYRARICASEIQGTPLLNLTPLQYNFAPRLHSIETQSCLNLVHWNVQSSMESEYRLKYIFDLLYIGVYMAKSHSSDMHMSVIVSWGVYNLKVSIH